MRQAWVASRRVAPATPDEQLLVDIDLAILGAAPARVRPCAAAVFNEKRGAILAGFLARPTLYGTLSLRERFEAPARANFQAALNALPRPEGLSSR